MSFKSSTIWNVSYSRSDSYKVVACEDLFDPSNLSLLAFGKKKNSRRFFVIDSIIRKIYEDIILDYFNVHNIDLYLVSFLSGESQKSFSTYNMLLQKVIRFKLDRRNEPILSMGGGVLTDVVGFVSSSYRRGVPHLNIPTTLMGYVDAAIGVKVGINFYNYKNISGAFYPSKQVLLDKRFLLSLSFRHIRNGLGEILKIAIIKNIFLFRLIEGDLYSILKNKFQCCISMEIINCSIKGLLEELEVNLFEGNLTRMVDFGHTFSPLLEMSSDILHGEAVITDIVCSCILSYNRILLSWFDLSSILRLLKYLNFRIQYQLMRPDLMWNALQERMIHRSGFQRVPIPYKIGRSIFVNNINYEELRKLYNFFYKGC